eukprot:7325900-Lingulodinium_polyedra.AAC.1
MSTITRDDLLHLGSIVDDLHDTCADFMELQSLLQSEIHGAQPYLETELQQQHDYLMASLR